MRLLNGVLPICAILLVLGTAQIAKADDTYFFMAAGALYPTREGVTNIEMQAERIRIELYRDYYITTVDFDFYNPGPLEQALIGFPIKTQGIHGEGVISGFQSWTNGVLDNVELSPIDFEWKLKTGIGSAWTRVLDFAGREWTGTRVRYQSSYGRSSPSDSLCTYLYGTGAVWSGPIGSVSFSIVNHTDRWIYDIKLGRHSKFPESIEWISDSEVQFQLYNLEPEYTDTLRVHLGPMLLDRGPRTLPSSYWLDERELQIQQLEMLSTSQLRLLRNLIYAINGYSFKSLDLAELYGSLPWYKTDSSFTESLLNKTEKRNVQIIVEEEARRRRP